MVKVGPAVAGAQVPSGFESVGRTIGACAEFRKDTAEFLRTAFPGKGFERGISDDCYEVGLRPTLFAPTGDATIGVDGSRRNAGPVAPAPRRIATPVKPLVVDPEAGGEIPAVGRPTPSANAHASASASSKKKEKEKAAGGEGPIPPEIAERLEALRVEDAQKASFDRFLDRHIEDDYKGDIREYELGRADRHWYDDFILNKDRYRDDLGRMEERMRDEVALNNRRLETSSDSGADKSRLDRLAADDRTERDRAERRTTDDRAERERNDRREYEARAARDAADRREADLRAARDSEERRRSEADMERRRLEADLERRRNGGH